MKYRKDHLRILELLADELPKRVTFTVEEIALKFKDRANPDRAARNALRKPKNEGMIEGVVGARGSYRLTSEGVSFMKKYAKGGYEATPDRKASAPKMKNVKAKAGTAKAAAKQTTKKIVKAEKAAAPAKKVVKEEAKPVRRRRASSETDVAAPKTADGSADSLGIH
jgi:hypothetical protein